MFDTPKGIPQQSRTDVSGVYGYFHPFSGGIGGTQYQAVSNKNATLGIAYYLNHFVGLQVEGGYFSGNSVRGVLDQCTPSCSSRDQLVYTLHGGGIVRYHIGRFIPYAHLLAGGTKINGPFDQPLKWGPGGTIGFGTDYVLPHLGNRIAFRMLQVDFQYSHVDYGALSAANNQSGGVGSVIAYKLASGLVVRLGRLPIALVPALACSVEPAEAYPGDPVTATGIASNLDVRHPATYTWTSTAGPVRANGASAMIATAGREPGHYVVSGHVATGPKATAQADCNASLTLLAYGPPTITCMATPSQIMPGESAAVKAVAASPQNRPLTYTYAASAGEIHGSTSDAVFAAPGVAPEPVSITCSVADDAGNTASAKTSITIRMPAVAEVTAVQPRDLCAISFARDTRRPVRVDNEAKACLDNVALTMNRESSAKLILVGNQIAGERNGFAAARVTNTRSYLVDEKGIDPSRIELRVASEDKQTVHTVLLLPGAAYAGDSVVTPAMTVAPEKKHRRR
jgi:hypothetical protein